VIPKVWFLAESLGASWGLASERLLIRMDSYMVQEVVPSDKWCHGATQKRAFYLRVNSFWSDIIILYNDEIFAIWDVGFLINSAYLSFGEVVLWTRGLRDQLVAWIWYEIIVKLLLSLILFNYFCFHLLKIVLWRLFGLWFFRLNFNS
jgi:hypothetical protein